MWCPLSFPVLRLPLHLQDEPHGTQEFEAPPAEIPPGETAQHVIVNLPDRGGVLAAVAGTQVA